MRDYISEVARLRLSGLLVAEVLELPTVYRDDPRDRGLMALLYKRQTDALAGVFNTPGNTTRKAWRRRHSRLDDSFERMTEARLKALARTARENQSYREFVDANTPPEETT